MPNAIRVAVHASSTVNATYVRIALRATFSTWISCSVVDCGSSFGPTPSPPPPGGSSWTASSCFAASNDNGYCTIYCGSDSSNGACYDLRNNNEYACDNAVEFCQSLGEPTGDVECVPQYCAVCGNGLCEQSETCSSCTVDCCPGELNCDDATDCEECAQMTDCGWCGTFCIASGAVLLHLEPTVADVGDQNADLVNLFRCTRDRIKQLLRELRQLSSE